MENKGEKKEETKIIEFEPKEISDFTLILDNISFKVHKAILMVNSSVFASVLRDTKENYINLTGRTNHNPIWFLSFLKEIYYPDESTLSQENIDIVLFYANFYNVKFLLKSCDIFVSKMCLDVTQISAKNMVEMLNIFSNIACKYKLFISIQKGLEFFKHFRLSYIKDCVKVDNWNKNMGNLDKEILLKIINIYADLK